MLFGNHFFLARGGWAADSGIMDIAVAKLELGSQGRPQAGAWERVVTWGRTWVCVLRGDTQVPPYKRGRFSDAAVSIWRRGERGTRHGQFYLL